MIKSVITLLIFLVVITTVAQETKLDIQFDHEWSLKKFLVKQVRGPETRSLPARLPYVHSVTIKLTIDLKGEVIDLGYIEKAEDDVFNKLFEKLVRSTSGKWKIIEASDKVGQVYVIIPYLHRTPPDDRSKYPKDLEEQFTTYHNNLSFADIEGCDATNCIILPQITNYTGTPVR